MRKLILGASVVLALACTRKSETTTTTTERTDTGTADTTAATTNTDTTTTVPTATTSTVNTTRTVTGNANGTAAPATIPMTGSLHGKAVHETNQRIVRDETRKPVREKTTTTEENSDQ